MLWAAATMASSLNLSPTDSPPVRRQAYDVLAGHLPRGVRLAGYFGDAADLPREAFQEILDAVAADQLAFPVDRVYDGLEQVPQAHDDMEHDRAAGKLVVRVRH
jgi:NADPH-dependent curcumin reductase CurA